MPRPKRRAADSPPTSTAQPTETQAVGTETPYRPRRVSDPRALRALAHPVRIGIIELLSVGGAMTATELGDALDESPANCSWHLRKLAEHGFVAEARGGTGRQRPWQMTSIGFSTGGPDMTHEERTAASGLHRVLLQRFTDRTLAATEQLDREDDPTWRDAAFHDEHVTWLTANELVELERSVSLLVQPYRERLEDPSTRPEGARLVELIAWGTPVDGVLGRDPRSAHGS